MIALVHAHPDPESFTVDIAAATVEHLRGIGRDVVEVDLYRCTEGAPFPPLLDTEELKRKTSLDPVVQEQMRLVEEAEGYVVIHPDWWGGPPAVLKGWIDRVLRPGTAYEVPESFSRNAPEGLLTQRLALVVASGDGECPPSLEDFWLNRVWSFCGVKARLHYLAATSEKSRRERAGFISEVCSIAGGFFGEDQTSSSSNK